MQFCWNKTFLYFTATQIDFYVAGIVCKILEVNQLNTKQQYLSGIVFGLILQFGLVTISLGQQPDSLDATKHPLSPQHQSLFTDPLIPLDTKVSWKDRFKGNEEFNADEMLIQMHSFSQGLAKTQSEMMMPLKEDANGLDAMGEIKSVKPDQGKIKIKHGPIEKLGMPEMTMVFRVEDSAILQGLEKGQEVGFSVDNSAGGFIVTEIMPVGSEVMTKSGDESQMVKAGGMDAQGIVKTIRASQGKVKIEHGPIEKLGMPSMTMVFKVTDPALLNSLEKGEVIDFSVDNTSGGFVITDIQPAKQ